MVKKNLTSIGDIRRVHIDRRQREAEYNMPSHHCHPYFELCCVEQGSCRFLVEDMLYDLHEGDYLLIPPQIFHFTNYLFGPCMRCGVYFRASDLDKNVIELLPGREAFFSRIQVFRIPEPNGTRCHQLLSRMAEEEQTDDARSPLLLQLQLQELFLMFSRGCEFPRELPSSIRTADHQVLKAARFINERYRQQISSSDIAAAAGFSPNYLSRKFREATGVGVHEYLVYVRLRSAALELLSTDNSITYIATHCGFSDSNYFKDAFKKKYGVTPREYRDGARSPKAAPSEEPGKR